MGSDCVLIVSSEHGGNAVPGELAGLFGQAGDVLETHRGYDIGVLPIGKAFAKRFDVPYHYTKVSRLVADLNRSVGSRTLYSEFTRGLSREEKAEILRRYYQPHRERVTGAVRQEVEAGRRVVHLSVHTFTPVFDGEVRNADVGLLYDPKSAREAGLCYAWREALLDAEPGLRIRRNYPYLGYSDALITTLRRQFGPEAYAGIELEVNQAFAEERPAGTRRIGGVLARTFETCWNGLGHGQT